MKLALGPLRRREDGAERQRTRERNIWWHHAQFVILLCARTPNCRVRCCEDEDSCLHRSFHSSGLSLGRGSGDALFKLSRVSSFTPECPGARLSRSATPLANFLEATSPLDTPSLIPPSSPHSFIHLRGNCGFGDRESWRYIREHWQR